MGLHYPLADGEAQARPRDVPSPVLAVDAGELPKQVRQPLGGYPSALVRDGDSHVVSLPHGGYPDGRRLVGVPGRVGEEVVKATRERTCMSDRLSLDDLLLATLEAVSRFRVGQRDAVSAALDAGPLLTKAKL